MFYKIIRFFCNATLRVLFKIEQIGIENFPNTGATIVYSNHRSMWDPVIIGCLLKRPVFFMAKEELFKNYFIGFVLKRLNAFPVKRGFPDRKAIRKALKILNDNQILGIFPEGTRSQTGELQEPEPGVALLAARSDDVTMVPIAIRGNYKWFSRIEVVFGKPVKFFEYHSKGNRLNSQKLRKISIELFNEIPKLMQS